MEGGGDARSVHGVAVSAATLASAQHDALVLVLAPGRAAPPPLGAFLDAAALLDRQIHETPAVLRCPLVAGERLVVSPTGPIDPYDDVRSIGEAALAGVQRALGAGSLRPALLLQEHAAWPRAPLVALLAALEALYVPLQIRESFPQQAHAVRALGVVGVDLSADLDALIRDAVALETARGVARDIGGADPERMAPPRVAEYLRGVFGDPAAGVALRVERDPRVLAAQYPLLAAVSRAADAVDRHAGCVIFLEYVPKEYDRTVMLVGKGVTYDTGGCDIKAGGAMAGMSRDKCGAAAVAGFLKACALLRPRVKVLAALGVVRNSVGEHAYVADELLASRGGLAVRVGNTDAEGRMVMADLLHEMRERAAGEREPHLYTVATLTGHAHRAYGTGYTAAVDNHAARARGHAAKLRAAGEALGDALEQSTLRREDLRAHRGRAPGDQLLQAESRASVDTPRGHQAPAAFLALAAGLAAGDVPYTHLDVAASAGSLPAPPTAAPLLALAAHYGLLHSR